MTAAAHEHLSGAWVIENEPALVADTELQLGCSFELRDAFVTIQLLALMQALRCAVATDNLLLSAAVESLPPVLEYAAQ